MQRDPSKSDRSESSKEYSKRPRGGFFRLPKTLIDSGYLSRFRTLNAMRVWLVMRSWDWEGETGITQEEVAGLVNCDRTTAGRAP